MATTIRNSKIPSNPRAKGNIGTDAVSPSVRGLKSIIPSTVGIAERARYEALVKAAGRTLKTVDALLTLTVARDSTDPALAAYAERLLGNKDFMAALQKAMSEVSVDIQSVASKPEDNPNAMRMTKAEREAYHANAQRESAANATSERPEAQPQSNIVEAPAMVEGDPDAAAGLIGDAALNANPFSGEAIDARREYEAKQARLKYAIERGDLATQHEIQFGTLPRGDEDPYKAMGHRGE